MTGWIVAGIVLFILSKRNAGITTPGNPPLVAGPSFTFPRIAGGIYDAAGNLIGGHNNMKTIVLPLGVDSPQTLANSSLSGGNNPVSAFSEGSGLILTNPSRGTFGNNASGGAGGAAGGGADQGSGNPNLPGDKGGTGGGAQLYT
jgi:hypothetical protein